MNEKIKIFLEKETGRTLENNNQNLIEAGILDSFSMVKLINFIEVECGVQLDMEELSQENFNSVATIGTVVEKQKKS